MITYICSHCDVTESAASEQRLLEFWEVVPRPGHAAPLRYCGTGCLIEAAKAVALYAERGLAESVEESRRLLSRVADERDS